MSLVWGGEGGGSKLKNINPTIEWILILKAMIKEYKFRKVKIFVTTRNKIALH